MNDHEPNVAIFWDCENCTPPCAVPGCDIVKNIRQIAHDYGSVKLFKAYLELSEQSLLSSNRLRSELQSCGVSLTDCPHNGRKDVADKMMIVDMLAFAIDTLAPATIVVISGDRDFVYAVSILRLRKYRVVLAVPSNTHYSLKSQASALLDWEVDVLRKPPRDGTEQPLDPEPTSNAKFASHRRVRSSLSSTALPSPGLERPQRRLSFRDANPGPTIKTEPFQLAAHISSARFRTVSIQTVTMTDVTSDAGHPTLSLSEPTVGTQFPTSSNANVTVKEADLRTSADTRRIPDPHMQLKDLEDRSLSDSSFAYRTHSSTAFQGNGKESVTSAVAMTPSPGVINAPLRAETDADSNQHIPSLASRLYSAILSSPNSHLFRSQLREQRIRLELTTPYDKTEDDDISSNASAATRPSTRASAAHQHGSLAIGSNPTEDVRIVARSPSPSPPRVLSVEHPACDTSTFNHTGFSPKPWQHTVEHPVPSSKLQEEFSQPSRPPVPRHFVILLEILEEYRSRGCDAPTRSQVTYQLMQRDTNAYESAGVSRWIKYALLAKEAGIVTLGGDEGSAWISLSPAWQNKILVQDLGASSTETNSSNHSLSSPAVTAHTTTVVTPQEQMGSSATADNSHYDTNAPDSGVPTKATPVEHGQCSGLPNMSDVTAAGVTPTDTQLESSSDAPGSPSLDGAMKFELDSSALLPIPVQFVNLLFVLEKCRKSGIHRPLRSVVNLALVEQNPQVYSFPGLKSWRKYAAAAEKEGIVKLGGLGGDAWVSLEPAWCDRVSVAT